ncbi:MAG: hypothetical protein IPJ85_12585 [Flavobacteriales bacterium]|nr:hypothetical protein [Flavobacteriales bacterium]
MKLTNDGLFDPSFALVAPPNGSVNRVFAAPNGSVLVQGSFTSVGSSSRNGWAHYSADGALTSLDLGADVGGGITCALYEANGGLIIGGSFTSVQGRPIKRLARFDSFGQLDTTFASNGGPNGPVSALDIAVDGSIWITGVFSAYAGVTRTRLAKVLPSGELDEAFDPGQSISFPAEHLRSGNDGTLLIAGGFVQYRGVACDGMAVLSSTGDPLLLVGTGSGTSGNILDVVYRPGERIIIAGYVNRWLDEPCRYMEALMSDGSLDLSFNTCTGANGRVGALAVQPDGRIVIGGEFTRYNGTLRRRLARLEADGDLDLSFDPRDGADGSVESVSVQADGRLLLTGSFNRIQNIERRSIARLLPTGDLDTTFQTYLSGYVSCALILPDGRILIAGGLQVFGDTISRPMLMLHPNGSVDESFDAGVTGNSFPARQIMLQPDGRILVVGQFIQWNGAVARGIVRLNPDGSRDMSFNTGTGPTGGDVRGVALQSDGRILIAGGFNSVNGVAVGRIARLDESGSLDLAFNQAVGVGASLGADVVAVDSFDRIVLAGSFGSFSGTSTWPVVRLNADGTRDLDFYTSTIPSNRVSEMVLQEDGSILVGGQFTSLAGVPRNRIARLGAGWVGLSEAGVAQEGLRVFPNPASQQFTIAGAAPLGEVLVLDMQGRVVHAARTKQDRLEIDAGTWAPGAYAVRANEAVVRMLKE